MSRQRPLTLAELRAGPDATVTENPSQDPKQTASRPLTLAELRAGPTADDLPTDENLRAAQMRAQERRRQKLAREAQRSASDRLKGFGEAALTVGSSALAAPVAQAAGTLFGVFNEGGGYRNIDRVKSTAEDFVDAVTYQPRTEAGQEYVTTVGEMLEPVAYVTDPFVANLALRELSRSVTTLREGAQAREVLIKTKDFGSQVRMRTKIKDKNNYVDAEVADVKIKDGSLVPDETGIKLVKEGLLREDVSLVTNANTSTKQKMTEMLDRAETGQSNFRNRADMPHQAVIGKSVADRLNVLEGEAKLIRSDLQKMMDGEAGDTLIDITSAQALFRDSLKKANVETPSSTIPKDGRKSTLADEHFAESNYAEFPNLKNLFIRIDGLLNKRSTNGQMSARDAHEFKLLLDDFYTMSSKGGEVNMSVDRMLALRKGINEALSGVTDQFERSYGSYNADLQGILIAQKPFENLREINVGAGGSRRGSWSGATTHKDLGNRASTALDPESPSSTKADLDRLDQQLSDLGVTGFNDDLAGQVRFSNMLTEHFRVSDEGLILAGKSADAGALQRNLADITISGALGNTFAVGHAVANIAGAFVRKGAAAKKAVKVRKKQRALVRQALGEENEAQPRATFTPLRPLNRNEAAPSPAPRPPMLTGPRDPELPNQPLNPLPFDPLDPGMLRRQ
jgi:hypothetical protein